MSLEDVQREILDPMQATYLPPHAWKDAPEEQKKALTQYAGALKDFSAAVLRAAWKEVVATHTTRAWPVPGVIVLAARKARKDIEPQKEEGFGRFRRTASQTSRRLTWEHARTTPIAADAADFGVAWSMKCQIMNDGKRLDEIDLGKLTASRDSAAVTARRIDESQPHFYRGRALPPLDGAQTAQALAMYRTIRERERETAEEIRSHQPAGGEIDRVSADSLALVF